MASGTSRESFWRRMICRQAESGLSIRSWCRSNRLAEPTFYWWRKELSRRDAARGDHEAEQTKFIPLRVMEDESSTPNGAIEIVLADQRRIRVLGRVDRQLLADVLCVLTSASSVEPEGEAC